MKKVFLVSADKVGKSMAGPGVRCFEMAKILSEHFDITLLVPDSCDIKSKSFEILFYNSNSASKSIGKLIQKADIVIAQNLRPTLLWKINRLKIVYIADLYDPLTVEVLEYSKYESSRQKKYVFDFNYYSLLLQINTANHLLCASNRQRDFYTGILSDQKLIDPNVYQQSPDIKKLISLVPFGLSKDKLPVLNIQTVKSKIPNLKENDKIIYWGGGIFNWFDPLSIIKAIEQISKTRGDIKLFFLGVKHPNPKIKQMEIAKRSIDYCKKKDLLDKFVFFNYGWTPYQERVHFLSRASMAISTHFDNLETRLSFRTRVLDYLWAELPMIMTKGDSMADLCQEKNLGIVVKFQNVKEIQKAILDLADDKKRTDQIKSNIAKAKVEFYWENCLKDLVNLIKADDFLKRPKNRIRFFSLSFKFYLAGFKKKFWK